MPSPRWPIAGARLCAARPPDSPNFARRQVPGPQDKFWRTWATCWTGPFASRRASTSGTIRRRFRGIRKCSVSLRLCAHSMITWPRLSPREPRPRSFFRGRSRMRSRTSDRSPCCAAWQVHRFVAKIISAPVSPPVASIWTNPRPRANSINPAPRLVRPFLDLLTHKRKFLRIRRPRIHVDRSLAAEDFAQYLNGRGLDLRSWQRHHAQ